MSKNYPLQATKRERAGKGAARSLRRDNKVPAVIYGGSEAPVTITLDSKYVNLEYRKGMMLTHLCDLDLDGKKNVVLARDVQLHPVTDIVEHVDFLRVTPKTKIAVMIPVHYINEDKSPSMKEKGVLNVVRYEVELLCSAMDIPEYINVDLTGVEMGATIRVSQVKLPEGTKPVIQGRDFVMATITEQKKFEDLDAPVVAAGEVPASEVAEPAEGEAAAAAGGDKAKDAKAPAADKGKKGE